jgi:uncharacterized membrane protein
MRISMSDFSMILLMRLVHIISGVVWTGALVFIAWLLLPATRASGPAGGSIMQQLVRVQRLPAFLVAAMLLTILSGLVLYRHDSVAFGSGWMRTGSGMTFSAGAAFALLAAIIGASVSNPAAKRLSALGAAVQATGSQPTTEQAAEIGRLQTRLFRVSRTIAVLLLLATAAMAIARYVP